MSKRWTPHTTKPPLQDGEEWSTTVQQSSMLPPINDDSTFAVSLAPFWNMYIGNWELSSLKKQYHLILRLVNKATKDLSNQIAMRGSHLPNVNRQDSEIVSCRLRTH
ncbi:uncharacterized protein CIMG_11008 [Coccidioides immitis RS]|uniref:Uncharacterized protein n=1 Tax=Coccidioides immitis (strain RS) TaxID=246410 RepID=A0A0D8JS58_COCIM|nr:uncharacterized protein CIMG_11008 [Coccidioides immitis RS]KJF59969.1 hypothetical protein CIMG_11008 [Coccidioides immitis RS]